MSEDWKSGDLAMCVKGGRILPNAPEHEDSYPVAGRIYTVESVSLVRFAVGVHPALTLRDGPLNRRGNGGVLQRGAVWPALRFCKIHPLTNEEHNCFIADLQEPSADPKRVSAAWRAGPHRRT
jgi:hypothetical protein